MQAVGNFLLQTAQRDRIAHGKLHTARVVRLHLRQCIGGGGIARGKAHLGGLDRLGGLAALLRKAAHVLHRNRALRVLGAFRRKRALRFRRQMRDLVRHHQRQAVALKRRPERFIEVLVHKAQDLHAGARNAQPLRQKIAPLAELRIAVAPQLVVHAGEHRHELELVVVGAAAVFEVGGRDRVHFLRLFAQRQLNAAQVLDNARHRIEFFEPLVAQAAKRRIAPVAGENAIVVALGHHHQVLLEPHLANGCHQLLNVGHRKTLVLVVWPELVQRDIGHFELVHRKLA